MRSFSPLRVVFLGIDGAGKTTHALRLSKMLDSSGFAICRIRPESLLGSLLPPEAVKWLSSDILRRYKLEKDHSGGACDAPMRGSFMGVMKAALNGALLSYAWIMHFSVVKLRLRRHIVVFDRYFYDWFYFLNGDKRSALIRMYPKPDLVFLLDLEVNEEAFSRMHSQQDKQYSSEYYRKLRNWYLTIAKHLNCITLNCDDAFEANARKVAEGTLRFLGD